MAVPPLTSWDVGVNPTSTILNTRIRDAINFLKARPHAVLRRITSNQTIPSGTATAIQWNTEDLDTDNGHSTVTNVSRYVAGTDGYYNLSATAVISSNASGTRNLYFIKNGNTAFRYGWNFISSAGTSGADMCLGATTVLGLVATDYVEVFVFQDSGSSLTVNVSNQDSRFEIEWVSSL